MGKVFVGLSGGVDSAVSAALLKQEGHDVTGAFIKIWQAEFLECTWRRDRLSAMRVAASLGIPFLEVDLSDEYKKEVVDSMLATYARGETPNPDVLCNRSIKFGAFRTWAQERGAEIIATGHYARIRKSATGYELLRGTDTGKDQSYFLHLLTQDDLAHTRFPIGGMTKPEVRAAAKRFALPVAERPDSQGLCFVGDVSMSDFLRRFIELKEGSVLDREGEIIGTHEGAALYTVGQRHGFTITRSEESKAPHYIVAVDTKSNTVTVSSERSDSTTKEVRLEDPHWIGNGPLLSGIHAAQTRYREKPVRVELSSGEGEFVATFEEPHLVSHGQSLVFYDEDICLGGGIMRPTSRSLSRR
jgi:tRNA-specific 2-thiouridylase